VEKFYSAGRAVPLSSRSARKSSQFGEHTRAGCDRSASRRADVLAGARVSAFEKSSYRGTFSVFGDGMRTISPQDLCPCSSSFGGCLPTSPSCWFAESTFARGWPLDHCQLLPSLSGLSWPLFIPSQGSLTAAWSRSLTRGGVRFLDDLRIRVAVFSRDSFAET
jgi:hypothetical protein